MRKFPIALLLFLAAPAHAHFSLTYPPARYADQLQGGPCGRAPETGRDHVTTLQSGAEIVVTWNQTISNLGYLRIAFDDDGQDIFVDPTWYTGDYYAGPWVLLDNIPIPPSPATGGTATVTLPNIECQNCTLQVIEVLSDHFPPWGNGDDFHYQCADLILVDDSVFTDGFENQGAILLISQVQTRGENGAADEFVEIYNPTDTAVMFDASWTLLARSATSLTYSSRLVGASQLIQPHRHILYTNVTGYNGPVAGDAFLSSGITDAGSLILKHNDDVVDAVCFHYSVSTQQALANGYTCEGTSASNLPHIDSTAGTSNTDASIARKPGGANGNTQDTDDNAADFYSNAMPDPHNLSSDPVP